MANNRCYYKQLPSVSSTKIHTRCQALIRSLNKIATYKLWYHHMGHTGKHDMKKLYDMVDGVTNLLSKKHDTNIPTVLQLRYPSINSL